MKGVYSTFKKIFGKADAEAEFKGDKLSNKGQVGIDDDSWLFSKENDKKLNTSTDNTLVNTGKKSDGSFAIGAGGYGGKGGFKKIFGKADAEAEFKGDKLSNKGQVGIDDDSWLFSKENDKKLNTSTDNTLVNTGKKSDGSFAIGAGGYGGKGGFKESLQEYMTRIQSDLTLPRDKIELASRILVKMYDFIIHLTNQRKKILIDYISPCIQDSSVPIEEALYIIKKSKCMDVVIPLCQYQRENRKKDFSFIAYIQIVHILARISQQHYLSCCDELESYLRDKDTYDIKTRMNIADILLQLNVVKGNLAIDELREEEDGCSRDVRLGKTRTVYTDPQNVHDTDINESVLRAVNYLCSHYATKTTIDPRELHQLRPTKRQSIEKVLERIAFDTAMFNGRYLADIMDSLWNYITHHPKATEIKLVLIDELCEMEDYCSSGHMSRLLNCLQGFDIEPELRITVGIDNEIYASFANRMKKYFIDNPNDMDMLTDNRMEELCEIIIEKIVPEFVREIEKVYRIIEKSQVMHHLVTVIVKYTNMQEDKVKELLLRLGAS